MKWRWLVLAIFLMLVVTVIWLVSRPQAAVRDLENTRLTLQREGFKVELSEFDFALSPELALRAAALGRTTRAAMTNPGPSDLAFEVTPDFPPLLTSLGDGTAVATWKLESWPGYRGQTTWPTLRAHLAKRQARLEMARQAAMAGPIRFEPIGSRSTNPLLPYLADLRSLTTTFGVTILLALHDDRLGEAWTNLLATTCLATSYKPEPILISQLVRFACMGVALEATWSALQAPGWTEEQLAALQQRWETVDLWTGLPETAAYSRAQNAALFQQERREPLLGTISFPELLRDPRNGLAVIQNYWQQNRYRHRGSYEDERAVLLFYRDRELELRRAVRAGTWTEMRPLPGVTNSTPFQPTKPSRVATLLNLRQMSLQFAQRGVTPLSRAAETEARRRLVVTALALERYHRRHAQYPDSLANLVPDFLKAAPIDFMNGQPLQYSRTRDGHFKLYSVGLDAIDDGGRPRKSAKGRIGPPLPMDEFGFLEGTDIVWLAPASANNVARFQEEEKRAEAARDRAQEESEAENWWRYTSLQQSNVVKSLTLPATTVTNEPVYRGRRLSEILWNGPGTNRPALISLLSLKQVTSREEPETVEFELPIRYDAMTNIAQLGLCVDREDGDEDEDTTAGRAECVRGENGSCRLRWNTIYETPGQHALAAALVPKDRNRGEEVLFGSALPFVVTNLCQFTPESATFNPAQGAKFYGRLPESNATYEIELKLPSGERVRTLSGSTSNGFFEVRWDLKDDLGRRCTNNAYDSVFQITLPLSGRSQRMRGP